MSSSLYDSKLYIEDLKTAIEHTLSKEKLQGITVLVTGASGTIGSFIVDMLCEYGVRVIACGRNVEKLRHSFSRYVDLVDFCNLDILDDSSFDNLPDKQVDYIIHAAGNAYPSAFIDHTDETVRGNICGTARLLEYGKKHGCMCFVYVSSGEVYSLDEEYRQQWAERVPELFSSNKLSKDKLQSLFEDVQSDVKERGPRSCYPVSKAATEAMTLAAGAFESDQMKTIVVRPCHTFGPGITGSDDRAHVQFAKKAVAGEDIVLNSAGTQLRSYNYVADAASGIVSAMLFSDDNKSDKERIFDICSKDNVITIKGLAELIAKETGVSVVIKEADERQKSLQSPINKQVLNSENLENIGWEKAFDLETGISHYLQILKETTV